MNNSSGADLGAGGRAIPIGAGIKVGNPQSVGGAGAIGGAGGILSDVNRIGAAIGGQEQKECAPREKFTKEGRKRNGRGIYRKHNYNNPHNTHNV